MCQSLHSPSVCLNRTERCMHLRHHSRSSNSRSGAGRIGLLCFVELLCGMFPFVTGPTAGISREALKQIISRPHQLMLGHIKLTDKSGM